VWNTNHSCEMGSEMKEVGGERAERSMARVSQGGLVACSWD
jgi:hypothetical protein